MEAEWNFFVTSDRNERCDGSIKHLATCANVQSLQENQIPTVLGIYSWA